MGPDRVPPALRLVPIDRSGAPSGAGIVTDETARTVCAATAALYERAGFVPPWIGYLAVSVGRFVGSCGFKSPPAAGRVEIAYFTFPEFEGRGIATAMARRLVTIARTADPAITLTAQTLRERNRSTRILDRLGFTLEGTVVHPEDGEVWQWALPARRPAGGP